MTPFDKLDSRILSIVTKDPRLSMSEISRRVKHGRDIVAYRFERLRDLGIVSGAVAVLNPFVFGLSIFKTYLRLRHRPKRMQELASFLSGNPYIFCIAYCEGQWDIIFNVVTRCAEQFDTIQDELLTTFRDIIITSEFAMITKHQTYLRVPRAEPTPHCLILKGTDTLCQSLDEIDLEILNTLATNARTPVAHIAKAVDLYPQSIERRIEGLQKQGVIAGYRLEYDRSALEQVTSKVQLEFSTYTKSISQRVQQFCEKRREVYKLLQQLGSYKYEIGLASDSYASHLQCMDALRADFDDVLRESTALLVRKEAYMWNTKGIKKAPDVLKLVK